MAMMLRSSRIASRLIRASKSLIVPATGASSSPINPQFKISSRQFIDLHKMGNKEAIEKEKARLSDELSRGYFADISEIRKNGGKIAIANKTLIPPLEAIKFPDLEVNLSNSSSFKLPVASGESTAHTHTPLASLLCLSFRASSQIWVLSDVGICSSFLEDIPKRLSKKTRRMLEHAAELFEDIPNRLSKEISQMVGYVGYAAVSSKIYFKGFPISSLNLRVASSQLLVKDLWSLWEWTMAESWSVPFVHAFNDSAEVQVYEVSFVDSWLLSLGPMRKMFIKMMKKSASPQRQIVYSFGDHYYLRKNLQILNLLTGYIFLLDRFGRIRWQGFGLATEEEVSSLLSCASLLLEEK